MNDQKQFEDSCKLIDNVTVIEREYDNWLVKENGKVKRFKKRMVYFYLTEKYQTPFKCEFIGLDGQETFLYCAALGWHIGKLEN